MANEKPRDPLTRRSALGMLAGAASILVGCSGDDGADPGVGSGGGGAGGAGGVGTGGGGAGGAAGSASGGSAGAGGAQCSRTPTPGCAVTEDNILGPFYKADAPFRDDITDGVPGQKLIVSGTVYGCDCVTPLEGAIVDIWQADDGGAYDNTGFVLRGRLTTDAAGHYELTTILPGFYLNGANYRPRHIHYKVSHPTAVALTTQLYFEGDPNFATDAFVKPSLIVPLVEEPAPGGGKQWRCTFDVVLA